MTLMALAATFTFYKECLWPFCSTFMMETTTFIFNCLDRNEKNNVAKSFRVTYSDDEIIYNIYNIDSY